MTFFSLLGLMVGECAKKFAQRTKNGPKSAFWGVLGEFCTGIARRAASGESFVPGELAGMPSTPATYQPRTRPVRAGDVSHCLVPKEDTDTAATADAKRMRRSGSASPPRSIAHVKAPWKASPE